MQQQSSQKSRGAHSRFNFTRWIHIFPPRGVISVIPSWFQTAKKCHKSFSTGSLALSWTSKLTNLAFPLRLSVWVDRALRCGVPGPVQISEDPGLTQPRCKKRSMTQCHPERQLTSYSFSQITWNAANKYKNPYKVSRFYGIILIWNPTDMWSLRIYLYMPIYISHDRHIVHLLWIILHFASKTKIVFFITLWKIDSYVTWNICGLNFHCTRI